MKSIRKVWTNLTSHHSEDDQRTSAAARSLQSEMFKSMGSLGSMLTLTTRASSKEEEEVLSFIPFELIDLHWSGVSVCVS